MVFRTATLLEQIKEHHEYFIDIQKDRRETVGSGLTISIAGLIMVLSAPVVYAQSTPTGET